MLLQLCDMSNWLKNLLPKIIYTTFQTNLALSMSGFCENSICYTFNVAIT